MKTIRTGSRYACLLLLAGGLAVCGLAGAQQFSYFSRLKEAEARAGAPGVFARLEAMQPERRIAFLEKERGTFDTLRTMRSLSGDADGAARASVWFDIGSDTPARYATHGGEALASALPEDAVQAIVREAGKRQVVILNEAHHVPLDRVFAGKLASALRKAGFTYLACEAFSENMPAHPASVRPEMGFYVNEPMYAGFVRGAIRDGWTFVHYDTYIEAPTQAERNRLREIGAARNLVDRIFSADPKAKVFIYVGYGHARKQREADKDNWKSLATLLKEKLGNDPLTVDQTIMYGRGDARVEHPQYRLVMQRFAPSAPVVLKAAAGHYAVIGEQGSYDMQVFHPDETMLTEAGRPLWMERQAGLRPHAVPAELLPESGRRLIQAFHADDAPGGVPTDMVMVEAGKPAAALMLPPGRFHFTYED